MAEEAFLYPVVRERLPDGDSIAGFQVTDHDILERLLEGLETPGLDDAEFGSFVGQLKMNIRLHIQIEESRLFPLLTTYLTEQGLLELGVMARRAMDLAPVRGAGPSDRPLVHTVLRSGVGLVGRVRDYLSDFGGA